MTATRDITLFIDPFSHHFLRDGLFDLSKDTLGGDNILAPWVYLRNWFERRGVKVFTADRLARRAESNKRNVYISFGIWENCRALARRADVILSAYFAFEGPIVEPVLYKNLSWVQRYFKRIYSFSDGESLKPFLRGPIALQHFCLPHPSNPINEAVWGNANRKFLVMINGNKLPRVYVNELYTERLRALEFFGRTDDIDLYGVGWNVPPYRMGKTWMPYALQRIHRAFQHQWNRVHPNLLLAAARKVYKGPAFSKSETLGQYTFALCFENQILNGWITEKIFDCFYAGTVPVYWGAPDIENYIPKECFIDMRNFWDYSELQYYLKTLSPSEIQSYRESARNFLGSEKFYPFTKEAFVERCCKIIEEDTGVRIA